MKPFKRRSLSEHWGRGKSKNKCNVIKLYFNKHNNNYFKIYYNKLIFKLYTLYPRFYFSSNINTILAFSGQNRVLGTQKETNIS